MTTWHKNLPGRNLNLAAEFEKKQHKTCIIFDFGGVLFDWSPYNLYDRFFENREEVDRFLKEIDFAGWNVQQDKGYPFEQAVAEKVAEFPHYEKQIRAYNDEWMVMFGGAITETVDVLASIKKAGYPLYALSNWSVVKFDEIRIEHEFLTWFDDIVLSGEVKIAKPDEGIYQALLDRTGRPAEECLFIDDSAVNIAAARELGFQTILYKSPQQLKSELQRQGYLD
jgi:2-haloacid dehalogenase